MPRDKDGNLIAIGQVVVDMYGRIFYVSEIDINERCKCENSCAFTYWPAKDLKSINHAEDLK